jgi:hypothetical protein
MIVTTEDQKDSRTSVKTKIDDDLKTIKYIIRTTITF